MELGEVRPRRLDLDGVLTDRAERAERRVELVGAPGVGRGRGRGGVSPSVEGVEVARERGRGVDDVGARDERGVDGRHEAGHVAQVVA